MLLFQFAKSNTYKKEFGTTNYWEIIQITWSKNTELCCKVLLLLVIAFSLS